MIHDAWMARRARSTRSDRTAPWRWLLSYNLLLLGPILEVLIWPGPYERGMAVGVSCLLAAITLFLFVGSRVAWCLLAVLDLLAVATLAFDRSTGPVFAVLRLLLLVGSPIRVYVWRPESFAEGPADPGPAR